MLIFYILAVIVIWLGVLSVRDGVRFAKYVRAQYAQPLPDFTPLASVIAPCRGLDQGLHENIAALFHQDYPQYELVFVTDSEDDPSLNVVRKVINSQREVIDSRERDSSGAKTIPTRITIAGKATDCGQKVHNLRTAVTQVDPRGEVLVFVDTDARPDREWLRSLVAPLHDEKIGAATGYRWFLPVKGGLASHLRSVWNASIASTLGPNVNKNFCWGGSTAIRRATFEKLNIRELWQGTVSDDFTMTRALQAANTPIYFVPRCLVPSLEDCTVRELFEFTTRQLKITRAYASHLWKAVLAGSLLFSLVFFGGLVLIIVRFVNGLPIGVPSLLLLMIFVLGAAKSHLRMQAISMPLANYRRELRNSWPAHLLLWPISSALYLYNALVAAFSRRIEWRGITYELKTPTEAVIIRGTD